MICVIELRIWIEKLATQSTEPQDIGPYLIEQVSIQTQSLLAQVTFY